MYRNKTEENGEPLVGNKRFEGYCAELAEKIAEIVKFDYVLKLVNDSKYGTRLDNGDWNGMVGELTRKVSQGQRLHGQSRSLLGVLKIFFHGWYLSLALVTSCTMK